MIRYFNQTPKTYRVLTLLSLKWNFSIQTFTKALSRICIQQLNSQRQKAINYLRGAPSVKHQNPLMTHPRSVEMEVCTPQNISVRVTLGLPAVINPLAQRACREICDLDPSPAHECATQQLSRSGNISPY